MYTKNRHILEYSSWSIKNYKLILVKLKSQFILFGCFLDPYLIIGYITARCMLWLCGYVVMWMVMVYVCYGFMYQ